MLDNTIRRKRPRPIIIAPERPADAPPVNYDNRHPFEHTLRPSQQRPVQEQGVDIKNDNNNNNEGQHRRRRRRHLQSRAKLRHEPIRITFDTTLLEDYLEAALTRNLDILATRAYLLLYHVLPQTAIIWKSLLEVVPVQGALYPLPNVLTNTNNNRNPYCPNDRTSGIPQEGTDLWIYVTFNRFFCSASNTGGGDGGSAGTSDYSTVASAISCERDQFDRPVTGALDFCLSKLNMIVPITNITDIIDFHEINGTGDNHYPLLSELDPNYGAIQTMIEITLHEVGHVLGMSSDSLTFFRNPLTGVPLSPRPLQVGVIDCIDGTEQFVLGKPSSQILRPNYVIKSDSTTTTTTTTTTPTTPSSSTATKATEEEDNNNNSNDNDDLFGGILGDLGESANDDELVLTHYEIRSPLVRQVIQNHFQCPTLTGAKLESLQSGTTVSDCVGSHWDERLFYGETMSAFLSVTKNVITPLTLAFLEESSWYRANYESPYVEVSSYGNLAGCDFVESPCIVDGAVPDYGEGMFCNSTMELTAEGFVLRQALPQTCDASHTQKVQCDLRELQPDESPPPEVLDYYTTTTTPKIPHSFTQALFCPIPTQQPTNCRNKAERFIVGPDYEEARETFGPDSNCFEVPTRDRAICLETECNPTLRKLQVHVLYGVKVTCQYDGQILTLLKAKGPSGPFQIKCPKLQHVCPNLICPANCSGRGTCLFDKETGEGHCECLDPSDKSPGCYRTSLDFVYSNDTEYVQLLELELEARDQHLWVTLSTVTMVLFCLVFSSMTSQIRRDRLRHAVKAEEDRGWMETLFGKRYRPPKKTKAGEGGRGSYMTLDEETEHHSSKSKSNNKTGQHDELHEQQQHHFNPPSRHRGMKQELSRGRRIFTAGATMNSGSESFDDEDRVEIFTGRVHHSRHHRNDQLHLHQHRQHDRLEELRSTATESNPSHAHSSQSRHSHDNSNPSSYGHSAPERSQHSHYNYSHPSSYDLSRHEQSRHSHDESHALRSSHERSRPSHDTNPYRSGHERTYHSRY